jgi:hypothetical protein
MDEIARKKIIKKSIKRRNKSIKIKRTKPVEKIKFNKIFRNKIEKNSNSKKI